MHLRRIVGIAGSSATVLFLSWPQAVDAQSRSEAGAARFDAWASLSLIPGGPTGELVTSYSPPLLFDGAFTSHAGQTLTVDMGAGVGVAAGFSVFFVPHGGVQVIVERQSSDATGTNSPYEYTLNYVSRPPPDNLPQSVTVSNAVAWPDTTGSLTLTTIAVNAVARIGRSDRIHGTISGGPAFHRLGGVLQSVAFTTFRLGGHSVLFHDDFRLAMTADSKQEIGFNVGGDLDVVVARHAAIVIGYRLYGGPDADVTFRPTVVLDPNAAGVQQSLDDIKTSLSQAPMRLPMTSSRFTIGFKFIG